MKQHFPHGQFRFLGVSSQEHLDDTPIIEALERSVPGLIAVSVSGVQTDTGLFLINLEAAMWGDTVRVLYELALKRSEHEPEFQICLSIAFPGLDEAAAVYQGSYMKLGQYRFYFPGKMVLIPDELPTLTAELPKFNPGQFTEQLKRLQLEEAFAELRQHVAALCSYYDNDVFQFKSFLGNMIFNVTHQFSHLKVLEEEKYDLFRSIDEAPNADAAAGILEGFLDRVMELASSAVPASGSHTNMKKLLEYIEEHYAEPLSLTELARHFHFNPSYLSSLFTAHNQEGFKEHLNTIRTDKAAVLLREGETPISEISSMVGYGDHSYFCKVFKKYTGQSPSGYRRQFYGQE
ncbi:helix-turn-helix transcriptional regulator [Paenibacillus sp. P46E]|uniref:helix-turn-helix transcriptional regulator n=1 Tax=Paenibacillus sp. P46E TaxID=1349436 RepID=UPI000938B423|nr:helix-turn-helix domain-containing protein [Paenibacillus sp. P46E]OKP95560.1 hypothetical protein A3849_25320 [Paenibacillus sp. P46E]